MFYEQINQVCSKPNHDNFMGYNTFQKLEDAILKVANFLGKSLKEDEVETLRDHLSFANFKNNKSVNFNILKELGILNTGEEAFVRKGKNGGWRDEFNEKLNERADCWIQANLEKTDMRFPSL